MGLWIGFLGMCFFGCSKLINVAVPGTIDERAINTKRVLNPWERNENHTLCLNSAKAVGCTVVNIGTQDFIEGRVCIHTFSCTLYNWHMLCYCLIEWSVLTIHSCNGY